MSSHDLAFAPSAPADTAPSSKVRDLVPGLLLFFARPSPLQAWGELFGHEWRHVGVTVQTSAGLRVASYGPRKCFRLDDPFELMPAYNRVGVARLFQDDDQVEALERFCRGFELLERSDSPYTFSGILMGPIHLTARRRSKGPLRTALLALVYLYCRLQQVRYRDRGAFACSTFAWAALDAVLPGGLRIPLSAHPDDEAAYATPSNERDELYARWLVGPTELWQAISESSRTELDLADVNDDDELVIDLTTSGTLEGAQKQEVGSSAESQTLESRRSALVATQSQAGAGR